MECFQEPAFWENLRVLMNLTLEQACEKVLNVVEQPSQYEKCAGDYILSASLTEWIFEATRSRCHT